MAGDPTVQRRDEYARNKVLASELSLCNITNKGVCLATIVSLSCRPRLRPWHPAPGSGARPDLATSSTRRLIPLR